MAFSESLDFGNSTFMNLENQVNHAINKNDVEEVASITGMKPVDIIDDSPTKFHKTLNRTRSRLMGATPSVSYKQSKFCKCKSDSILNVTIKENPQRQDNYSDFFRNDFTIEMQEGKRIKSSVKEELASPIAIVESMLEAVFADEFSFENPTAQHDTNISIRSGDFSNISAKDVPIFSEDFNEISGCASKPTADENAADIWQDPTACDGLEMQVSATMENAVEAEEIQNIDECSFVVSTGSSEEQKFVNKELQLSKQGVMVNIEKKFIRKDATISNNSSHHREMPPYAPKYSASKPKILPNNTEELKTISSWNLPVSVLREYEKKGIHKMFDWQIECLSNPKVLFEHCNLVYSAPTSAGKTLVSEILLIKTILERGKKVILILPFISVVREKMFYLQDLLTPSGYRVEGFFGGYTPPGGFDSIHVAICTIEKANSIVNKLMEQGKLDEIGNIVVDEVHLISDPGRGYILELLLAKILYMSRKHGLQIQVITMSATLANVELLKQWLDAELYVTQFRPVALQEMIKIGSKIYNCSDMKELRELNANETYAILQNDSDHVAQLCIETLLEGCSVVVFCPSKDWCEKLAVQLAGAIYAIGKSGTELGARLRTFIKREAIDETKKQLRDIPTGLDAVLERTITYACAFHHAGLTTEERDIVESSFKMGILKIIVATSTLSSGVNLPARRVLIRSPLFGGKQMSSLTYRQMIGRAGRTGKDILGESILICTESNARVGRELVSADLKPIASCLEMESSAHLKRALLEVISSGVATTLQDVLNFVKCTLLSAQKDMHDNEKNVESQLNDDKNDEDILPDYIKESLEFLLEYEFIRLQLNEETNTKNYMATRLGLACLASSMPPSDGLILFSELQKSRRCFVLESELHAVYLVTPYSVCYQMQDMDWLLYLDMWEKLTPSMKKVGELVGVKESFLVRAMRGQTKLDYKLMQIHKRFYTALALQELVNETPINQVALKYNCTRGMLQSLQQMASTFAGIVTAFCNSLHWSTLSLIVSQFKERLFFGIHHELIDLMRLPDLNQKRARALYDAGITNLIELANCDEFTLQKVLFNAISFDSAKQLDNENELETNRRNLERQFFITGKTGLTLGEVAKLLVQEARLFVQHEIGVGNINWSQKSNDNEELLHMSYEPINELKTVNEREKRKPDDELKSPPKLFKGSENENLTNSKEAIISKTKQIPNADLSTKNQTENKMESIPRDDVKQNTKYSNKENFKSQQLDKIKNNNSFPKPKLPVEHKTPLANKELSTKQNNKNDEVLKAQPITSKAVEPRRSPRNHMQKLDKSNERNLSKNTAFSKDIELLMADESFEIKSGIAKKLENENKKPSPIKSCISSPANENANSEEISSSQKTPVENVDAPRVSRLLRSYRLASPKTQLNPPITSDQDIAKTPKQNQTPTSSFEYAAESMAENSLIMNPKNLNASHILSCSKEDPEAGALCFQSVDIIDICGNTTLFKNAFKTLMSTKRIGFSVGLQMDASKRKPLIGANLLINQVGAANDSSTQEDVQFCLDDHTYCAGIAFSIADNCIFYMNMQDEETCKDLTKEIKCEYIRMILKSQNHTLLIYDAKEQLKVLRKVVTNKVDICVNLEDPKVANWLLQPDRTSNFGNLAQQFAPECTALVNLCGSGRGYNSIGLDADSAILAKVRCSIEACVTIHILKGQIENLERIGNGQLHKFFHELEMPMQLSLCNMEIYGFPTNTLELHKLSQQMVAAMKKVESRIYELNGSRFNLGSSSAVAKVVGLHHRNSNGRISTSRQILEKVDSPMTQLIVLYRKLSATLTKNIQPLLKCVVDNRIHGQSITFTSTGRIAMTEPNLQNVAKDFTVELEKEKILISCRKAFSPIDDKSCLISSDFCQLEMRILAHLSQDPALLRVMHSENDVFTAIAARWNKIPEDNVSEQLRNGTKQICYGIVYGMGMRSLAEALKCTEKEALSVSEQFHAAYPGIRVYADKIIKFARNNGYIETITGRRRYLDHINSSESTLKSQAERQAVNSTIQGSAADIAKSAIIRIEKNISKYCEKLGISMKSVQLVLHLHDELIFEVPEEKAKKIAKLLSVTMENCVKLSVPLKVKLRIGKTWGSLKEVKL